jgi:hypothetical protein
MMDFSNISKRSDGLAFEHLIDSIEPGSYVIVDSTGLKVYGQDEITGCNLHYPTAQECG